VKLEIMVLNYL